MSVDRILGFFSNFSFDEKTNEPAAENPLVKTINSTKKKEESPGLLANYWNELKADVSKKIHSQTVAVIATVASSILRFNPEEVRQQKEKNRKMLGEIFGGNSTHAFLMATIPQAVKKLTPLIEDLENGAIREYLLTSLEPGKLVFEVLEILISQVIINLCLPLGEDHVPGNGAFLKIFPRVTEIVFAHWEAIDDAMNNEIARLDPALSKSEMQEIVAKNQKKQIQKIFSPLSENLLALAFPNGADDMPLCIGFKGVLWDLILDFGSECLYEAYWIKKSFNIEREPEVLMAMPHGEFYNCLSDFIPEVFDAVGMKVLGEAREILASFAVDSLKVDEDNENGIKTWLESLIYDFSKLEGPHIDVLKQLLQTNGSAILSQLFIRMQKTNEEGETVFCELKEKFFRYVDENAESLNSISQNLTEDERNQHLLTCFTPLVEDVYANLNKDVSTNKKSTKLEKFCESFAKDKIFDGIVVLYESFIKTKKIHDGYCETIKDRFGNEKFVSIETIIDRFINQLLKNTDDFIIEEYDGVAKIFYNIFYAELKKRGIDSSPQMLAYTEGEQPLLLTLLKKEFKNANLYSSLELKKLLRIPFLKIISSRIELTQNSQLFKEKIQFDMDTASLLIEVFTQHLFKINNGLSDLTNNGALLSEVRRNIASPSYLSDAHRDLLNPLEMRVEASKARIDELFKRFESHQNIEDIRVPLMAARDDYRSAVAEINAIRKEAILPFANNIFELISFEELQIPQFFSAEIESFLKDNVIPELLVEGVEIIMNPQKIKKSLLSNLKGINALRQENLTPISAAPSLIDRQSESFERLVNVCEGFLKEMTKTADGFQAKVFKSDFVLKLVSRSAAEFIEEQLSQDCDEVLARAEDYQSLLPLDEEVPRGLIAEDDISASTEVSAESIIAELLEEQLIEEEIQRELVGLFERSATNILYSFGENFKNIFKSLDSKIERNIGQIAVKIKRAVKLLFQVVFFNRIAPLLLWMIYPIYIKASLVAKKQFNREVVKIIETFNLSFNRSLIHGVSNVFVNRFAESQLSHSTAHNSVLRNPTT